MAVLLLLLSGNHHLVCKVYREWCRFLTCSCSTVRLGETTSLHRATFGGLRTARSRCGCWRGLRLFVEVNLLCATKALDVLALSEWPG